VAASSPWLRLRSRSLNPALRRLNTPRWAGRVVDVTVGLAAEAARLRVVRRSGSGDECWPLELSRSGCSLILGTKWAGIWFVSFPSEATRLCGACCCCDIWHAQLEHIGAAWEGAVAAEDDVVADCSAGDIGGEVVSLFSFLGEAGMPVKRGDL